jgi:hypothetical protein
MENFDGWISVDDYLAKYQDKLGALSKRVFDGVWARGVFYSSPHGRGGFVHEERAAQWLRERGKLPEGME